MKVKVTAAFASQAKDHACSKTITCWCEIQRQQATVEAYGEGSTWAVAACDAIRQIDADAKLRGKKRDKLFPAELKVRIV